MDTSKSKTAAQPKTAAQVREWVNFPDSDEGWMERMKIAINLAKAPGQYRKSKALDGLIEKYEAILRMREILAPGDTLYTVLWNVSRSGMMRHIDVYQLKDNDKVWLSGYIAKICGYAQTQDGAIKAGGCGMDMGFSVVYNFSASIFRKGHECIGKTDSKRCPSNDHANGDREYKPHKHRDGGYAINQRWL